MANVLVQDTALTAIADAIREKNGSTDTYKPGEMAAAISEISVGSAAVVEELNITNNGTYTAPEGIDGYSPVVVNVPQDGAPSAEDLVITGDCQHRFSNNGWNWVINKYGNQITTNNISNCQYMFANSTNLTKVPFEINIKNKTNCAQIFNNCRLLSEIKGINGAVGDLGSAFYNTSFTEIPDITCDNSTYYSFATLFSDCKKLEKLPYLINAYPETLSNLFSGCQRLREIPEDWVNTWNFSRVHTNAASYGTSIQSMFQDCYSLRKIPNKLLSQLTTDKINTSSKYYRMFYNCASLDELVDFPVDGGNGTGNHFSNSFESCARLKDFTFAINEDGTVKTANWKNQLIDLSYNSGVGSCGNRDAKIGYVFNYNSGLTQDKYIIDDATYQALKDDPDATAKTDNYSRYNHDSAVRTINSLPDTSAYLATAGGTNTIRFLGREGADTDGGAINTLTE